VTPMSPQTVAQVIDSKRLGSVIRSYRRAVGMTQAQLAERLGIHLMTVSKYEAGTIAVSIDRLAEISAALGVSLVLLLTDAGYQLEIPMLESGPYPAGRLPEYFIRDPKTGEGVMLDLSADERTAEERDSLRESAARMGMVYRAESTEAVASPAIARVIRKGGEASPVQARHAKNLPLSVREYLADFQLRLVRGGAAEDEVEEAMALLKSPEVFTFYKGGVPSEFNEDEVLRGMKAIGEGVIIPTLQERGRKVK
jgi:transcriptional regulator with XRE-family HTH domain